MADKEDTLNLAREDYTLTPRTTEGDEFSAVHEELEIELTEEERDALSNEVLDLVDEIISARTEWGLEELWQQWEDQYYGIVPEKDFPWPGSFNLHVPLTAIAVDTIDSVLEQAVLGVSPIFLVDPQEGTDFSVAQKKEQFLDYETEVRMDLPGAIEPIRFDAEVLGTGWGEIIWDKDVERVKGIETWKPSQIDEFLETYPDIEEKSPELLAKLEKGETLELVAEYNDTLYEGVKLRHVDNRDVIVHPETLPTMEALRKTPLLGKRMYLRYDDLLRLEKQGIYQDVKKVKELRTRDEDEEERFLESADVKLKEFTIYTCIYRTDINEDGLEERILIDIEEDSGHILRVIVYPYWHSRPFLIPFYIQRRKNFIYGLGIAEMLQDLNEETNALHNQTLDAGTIANSPSFKALKSASKDFNPYRDKWYPGKVWWLDDLQSVQEFNVSVSNGAQIFMQMGSINSQLAELRTGSTQNLSGLESSRDPEAPAKKTQTLIAQSMSRLGKYISTFQASMKEVAYQIIELNYQFVPDGVVFRVMNTPEEAVFPKLTRQELRMRVDYRPHGTLATFNKDQAKKDAREIYTILRQEPLIAENPFAVYELIKTLIETQGSHWEKKINKLIPDEESYKKALGTQGVQNINEEFPRGEKEADPNSLLAELGGEGSSLEEIL